MRPTGEPVERVLAAVTDERRRGDADELVRLMSEITGEDGEIWASRIVGFGRHRYQPASGRSAEEPLLGFAVGAKELVIYLVGDYETRHAAQVERLGTYRGGKCCLYAKRLADLDMDALRELLDMTVRDRRGADHASGRR